MASVLILLDDGEQSGQVERLRLRRLRAAVQRLAPVECLAE
jgi:hypothetical protein